jgi:serine/threonine protein kinase
LNINEKIKIADLGTAKNLEQSVVRSYDKGTREYRSPEMLKKIFVTFNTDVWSAGVVFYEMIEFKLPFDNNDEILNAKIPNLDSDMPGLFQFLIIRY